jgi:hypothetical protein
MQTKTNILVGRDDKIDLCTRAGGRGGVAISFSSNNTTTYIHLFEGAMYELYNQLKAHIERQAKFPTATNVVRLGSR